MGRRKEQVIFIERFLSYAEALIPSRFADFAIVFLQNGFGQTSELGRKLEFKKVPYVRTK